MKKMSNKERKELQEEFKKLNRVLLEDWKIKWRGKYTSGGAVWDYFDIFTNTYISTSIKAIEDHPFEYAQDLFEQAWDFREKLKVSDFIIGMKVAKINLHHQALTDSLVFLLKKPLVTLEDVKNAAFRFIKSLKSSDIYLSIIKHFEHLETDGLIVARLK